MVVQVPSSQGTNINLKSLLVSIGEFKLANYLLQ